MQNQIINKNDGLRASGGGQAAGGELVLKNLCAFLHIWGLQSPDFSKRRACRLPLQSHQPASNQPSKPQ